MTGTCNRLDEDKAGPVWTNNCVSNLICLFTFCLPWNSQLVFWSIFALNSIIKYKFQVKSDWPFHLTRWIWNNRSVKPVKILKLLNPETSPLRTNSKRLQIYITGYPWLYIMLLIMVVLSTLLFLISITTTERIILKKCFTFT